MIFKRRDNDFSEGSSLGGLGRKFSELVSGDDSIRETGNSSVVAFLLFPFRLAWGFLIFIVQAWSTSRPGFCFIRGLPALSVIAATPFVLWGLNYYYKQISLGPTMGYHSYHRRNADMSSASLFSQKLIELEPNVAQFKYLYAEDLAAKDPQGATRIMEWLAQRQPGFSLDGEAELDATNMERNEAQFAQANVWLSQRLLLEQRLEGFDEGRNEQAMAYLEAAISATPEDMKARLSLAELYLSRAEKLEETDPDGYVQNLNDAKEALERVVSQRQFSNIYQVIAMPRLVNVCVKLGDDVTAERVYSHATAEIGKLARNNPNVFELWLSLVQCSVSMKKYERASEFIREGYRMVKDKETRRKIIRLASLVFLRQADDFPDLADERQFKMRLYALCRAIQTNPRDPEIYFRLMDYIDTDVGGEERDVWLRNSLVGCPIPSIIHIIMGTRELNRGNIVNGQAYWDIAQQQFSTTEFVIHRLLSYAVNNEEKYAASSLVTKAIEMFPEQYMLYETRGALKRKAGDYEGAIEDLKIVLAQSPDLITTHKLLQDCYEKVGNTEKAEFHRQKVQELLEKLEEKERDVYEQVLDRM